MKYLLFLGIGQSAFFVINILIKKDKKKSDWWVFAWLILLLFHLLFYFLSYNSASLNHLSIAGFFLPLLYGPINFIYINQLLKIGSVKWWGYLFHSLPYLFMTGIFILSQSQIGNPIMVVQNGWLKLYSNSPYLLKYYGVILALQAFLYVIVNLFFVKKHQKKVKEYYSNTKDISLEWPERFLYMSCVAFIIIFITISFNQTIKEIIHLDGIIIIMITLIIEVFYLGFFSQKQREIVLENQGTAVRSYTGSNLTNEKLVEIIRDLEGCMTSKKPYLNPELSLSQLSQDVNISHHLLSQVINTYYNRNFFDHINHYRIEDIKNKLQSSDYNKFSLLGIAFDSGFSSKSAFNKAFKKATNMTPSEYKNSHQMKE